MIDKEKIEKNLGRIEQDIDWAQKNLAGNSVEVVAELKAQALVEVMPLISEAAKRNPKIQEEFAALEITLKKLQEELAKSREGREND